MHKTYKLLTLFLVLAFSFASISLYAQTTKSADSKPQKIKSTVITSDLNGFSVRIPDSARKTTDKDARYLAQWGSFDKDANPLWRITISKRTGISSKLEMDKYVKYLAGSLESSSGNRADIISARATLISNRNSAYIEGKVYNISKKEAMSTGMDRKLISVFYQTHIIYKPGVMITFQFEAVSKVKNASQIWNKICKSINIFDNTDAIKQAEQAAANTIKLLKNLSAKKVANCLPKKPKYFILYKNHKPVGWIRETYKQTERDNTDGFLNQTYGYLFVPKKATVKDSVNLMQLLRSNSFLSDNFDVERWSRHTQISVPGNAKTQTQVLMNIGIRKQLLIVTTAGSDKDTKYNQKEIPKKISRILLDKTIEKLFTRLINLKDEKQYSFSTYNSEDDQFTFKNYTVCKPCKTLVQGRTVNAIKIEYLPAQFEKKLEIYVDAKGNILKRTLENGITQEAASWDQIKVTFTDKRHAEPTKLLNAMIKASQQNSGDINY